MKMSTKKKWGYLHVRGGRVLEVVHDHQVPTNTLTQIEVPAQDHEGQPVAWRRRVTGAWETAKAGDMAIEIVAVKTGNVLGYAYLSGDALQLTGYADRTRADWFTPIVAWRAKLSAEGVTEQHEVARAIVQCRCAPVRMVAFSEVVDSMDIAKAASLFVREAAHYLPGAMTEDIARSELIAHVIGRFHTKKGEGSAMHFQPPRDAQDNCAAGFHMEIVASSLDLVPFDPFGPDVPLLQKYATKAVPS